MKDSHEIGGAFKTAVLNLLGKLDIRDALQVERLIDELLLNNIIIQKGDHRHKKADIWHKILEGERFQLVSYNPPTAIYPVHGIILSNYESDLEELTFEITDKCGNNISFEMFDEVKLFEPLPDYSKDDLLIVSNQSSDDESLYRYFSHFDKDGNCICFSMGCTSYTANATETFMYHKLSSFSTKNEDSTPTVNQFVNVLQKVAEKDQVKLVEDAPEVKFENGELVRVFENNDVNTFIRYFSRYDEDEEPDSPFFCTDAGKHPSTTKLDTGWPYCEKIQYIEGIENAEDRFYQNGLNEDDLVVVSDSLTRPCMIRRFSHFDFNSNKIICKATLSDGLTIKVPWAYWRLPEPLDLQIKSMTQPSEKEIISRVYEFTGRAVSNELAMNDGSLCIDGMVGESGFEVVNYANGIVLEENAKYHVVISKVLDDGELPRNIRDAY